MFAAALVGCQGTGRLDAPQPVNPPLMGWSSWNAFRVHINGDIIRQQTDLMVELGLKDVGYTNINIDDGYFGPRDEQGNMTPNPQRFPEGLKEVTDYIHSKGLKAGNYTDAGVRTCGSFADSDSFGKTAGIYMHESQDADLYFKQWGFDFIKIDFCGGTDLGLDERQRYTDIRRAMDATGKKVSLNICRWAFPGTWAKDIADSWRISGDINASWNSIKDVMRRNMYLSAYAGDGHYNDMDMLVVGFPRGAKVGGGGLTQQEEEAHFGLWCIMSSPLLIGCNLAEIPESSLALLKNKELIAINQDVLGLQAYVVQRNDNGGYVLVKDILEKHGTTRAVALYNPTDTLCAFDVPLSVLELGGNVKVRDLIRCEDLGVISGNLTRELPAHSAMILKMEGEQRLESSRYEAEWAYLPEYNELDKNSKGIVYRYEPRASGKMKVSYLGGRPGNYAEWKDVYSSDGGEYDMTITYFTEEDRSLEIEVNGQKQTLKGLNSGGYSVPADITVPITLKSGYNTIRIGRSDYWAPDIDGFTLAKK